MNAMTLALFSCTWGFAISSLMGLRAAWRAWQPKTLASQRGFAFRAACTLLALVWTQYQYFVFPIIFGLMGVTLLRDDWRRAGLLAGGAER